MARYIDADKLISHLKDEIKACEPKFGSRANGKSIAYGTKLGLQSAISFAETLAADVAPKSEVERLTDILNSYALQYGTVRDQSAVIEKAKAEVAREIFEEIEKHLFVITPIEEFDGWVRMMLCDFERLKKKYTEGKR